MSTLTGTYVRNVKAFVPGVSWAGVRANRMELTVRCDKGVDFFTVQRDAGHGFQDPILHEEFYPGAILFYDYTAPGWSKGVLYRASFYGSDRELLEPPVVISVPTKEIYPEWGLTADEWWNS